MAEQDVRAAMVEALAVQEAARVGLVNGEFIRAYRHHATAVVAGLWPLIAAYRQDGYHAGHSDGYFEGGDDEHEGG